MATFQGIPTNGVEKVKVHSLPCHIYLGDSDIRAPLTTYFKPATSVSDGLCRAQFRGRALVGRSLSVPLSHVGLILTPGAEGVAACQGFDEATVWGHDMAPSDKENVVTKIREHAEVMSALHDEDDE